MLVLTVFLIVLLLTLIPLRIAADFRLDLDKMTLFATVRVYFVPVFREKLWLEGKYLAGEGSVDTKLDLSTADRQSGINFAAALVFDSVDITFAIDYTRCSPYVLPALEALCGASTAVFCAFSHCRLHTNTHFSLQNALFCEVVVSVSLAELLTVLASEGIRKWKINKSVR